MKKKEDRKSKERKKRKGYMISLYMGFMKERKMYWLEGTRVVEKGKFDR